MRKQDNNYDKQSRTSRLKQNLSRIWHKYLKDKPTNIAILGSVVLILGYFLFSGNTSQRTPQAEQQFSKEQEQKDTTSMSGIKEAVDPRDVWTNRIENKIEQSASEAEENYHKSLQEKDEKIAVLEQKLNNEIKALRELVVRTERNIAAVNNLNPNDVNARTNTNHQQIQKLKVKSSSRLGYVKRIGHESKKDLKDYAPSGSHVRAVLLTGLAVGTGTNSSSSPEPIVLRLTDSSLFAKGYKTEQLAEATLIGDCSGDISSERAKCRLQTLSLKNRKGEIIEKPIEGWVIGEDGRAGIKGVVVDKSSNVARTAVLSGVLSGISQFFQNQATKGVFPISAITGQANALKPTEAIKGGVFAGAGNAMEKLADYAIARAESMSPVLMIASGREVDVVFRKGIDLNEDGISTTINNNSGGSSGIPQDQSVSKLGERETGEIIGSSSNFSRGTKLSAKYLGDSNDHLQSQNEENDQASQAALMRVLQESPTSQISNDNQANNEVNNDWINTPATKTVDDGEAMIPAEYDTPINTLLDNNQASEGNTANQSTIQHQDEGF